ncbi:DUF5675 family protein [Phocaeicola vulgatus]|uniref:DUF5675 family protein n=1 Tax=Phocaeicola vulgatus TaxID=821 RepID=UPI001E4481A5|nr:DUF5675 family protein [Phocaeicola vulgatus]BDC07089.1 hypothetical protein GAIMETA21S03_29720 [Phocaeicola vulgatus]
MKLKVERLWKKPGYTVGRLYVDGKFFCNTLEDTVRDLNRERKIPGKTAIPYGEYKVVFNWSPKFGRNLPRLLNVPAFEGILIHPGNTADDSSGCILVGKNTEVGRLTESRYTSDKLNVLVEDVQRKGESITIEIV